MTLHTSLGQKRRHVGFEISCSECGILIGRLGHQLHHLTKQCPDKAQSARRDSPQQRFPITQSDMANAHGFSHGALKPWDCRQAWGGRLPDIFTGLALFTLGHYRNHLDGASEKRGVF